MKNTNRCPKCGCRDIILVEGRQRGMLAGNYILVNNKWTSKNVYVDRYICSNCGFSEEWIDVEDIETIKRGRSVLG